MGFFAGFISENINWIILLVAIITGVILFYTFIIKKEITNEIPKWEKEQDITDMDQNTNIKGYYNKLSRLYTVFVTVITLFPLFGMLGTVSALLSLDMSSADAIENAKENFFVALSSTFWGIVAAIGFKTLNAICLYDVEDILQRLLKVIKDLRQESIDENKKQKSGWQI